MINKLPGWVEIVGLFPAFITASVNTIIPQRFNHQGVSRLTGTASLLVVKLAGGNYTIAGHLGLILLSVVIGKECLKPGRR